ncbi:BT4734/BF3469 family protein [Seramator thermalis]|uniref:BT4734/BF3469 family protein n=1 Tax=Seramator thermalis TaxID=2496270 RepID=UPI001EEF1352|nr:BT4734/BF3469 family protein [Seramator thermalis]
MSNTKPHKAVRLLDIYNYIVGKYAKHRTEKLQAMLVVTDGRPSNSARHFKAANFDYCTFSGVFTTRNDKALVKHSGLLCLDFDHLQNVQKLRFQLLQDEYFETQLLFVSPSGNGLKWIIQVDITQATHADYFLSVANYLKATYNIEVDKSGKDTSRACFLPHDPQAFINPKLV